MDITQYSGDFYIFLSDVVYTNKGELKVVQQSIIM